MAQRQNPSSNPFKSNTEFVTSMVDMMSLPASMATQGTEFMLRMSLLPLELMQDVLKYNGIASPKVSPTAFTAMFQLKPSTQVSAEEKPASVPTGVPKPELVPMAEVVEETAGASDKSSSDAKVEAIEVEAPEMSEPEIPEPAAPLVFERAKPVAPTSEPVQTMESEPVEIDRVAEAPLSDETPEPVAEIPVVDSDVSGPATFGSEVPELLDEPIGAPDDLRAINGIGPKLHERLTEMGIFHFSQIASWTPVQVEYIEAQLKKVRGRPISDKWVAQASDLMK